MKRRRKFLEILGSVLLILSMILPVSAEETDTFGSEKLSERAEGGYINVLFSIDRNEELSGKSAALPVKMPNGGSGILASSSILENEQTLAYCLLVSGAENACLVKPTGEVFEEYGLAVFAFSEGEGPDIFQEPGGFSQGETLEVHYLDNELNEKSFSVTAQDYRDGSPFGDIYVELDNSNEEELQATRLRPCVLLNEKKQLCGMITVSGNIVAFALDEETFYGADASDSDEEEEAEQTEKEEEPAEEPEEEPSRKDSSGSAGTSKRESARVSGGGKEKDAESGGTVPYFVAVLVVVAGIVLAAAYLRKKKAAEKPVKGKTAGPSIEDIPMTEPARAAYVLHGISGAMEGKVYLLENGTITIGRDTDCEIRYPADTKGISRKHCRITVERGNITLTDLGSTYGTFLYDGRCLELNVPTVVKNGGRFYLGAEENTFAIIQR